MATDPVLSSPGGQGPLPGTAEGASPLLPGSQAAPEMPGSAAGVEDPTPGEPPVLPDEPD